MSDADAGAPVEGRRLGGWDADLDNLRELLAWLERFGPGGFSPSAPDMPERLDSARRFIEVLEQLDTAVMMPLRAMGAERRAIREDGERACERIHVRALGSPRLPLGVQREDYRVDPEYRETYRRTFGTPPREHHGDGDEPLAVEDSTPAPVFRPPAPDELPRHRGANASEPWPYGSCDDPSCWCQDARANVDAFLLGVRARQARSGQPYPQARLHEPGGAHWQNVVDQRCTHPDCQAELPPERRVPQQWRTDGYPPPVSGS